MEISQNLTNLMYLMMSVVKKKRTAGHWM